MLVVIDSPYAACLLTYSRVNGQQKITPRERLSALIEPVSAVTVADGPARRAASRAS